MQDLNDLRFFAAVVTAGGFSAAARELGLPKSRLSRRVALLEDELGVRLLERSTRRLQVTEIGRQVYAHARAAAAEADAAGEAALRTRAEPQGLVRLSCPLGLLGIIAAQLPAFLMRHPLLRVQMVLANRRIDLIEERVDVAVRVRERLDTDADLQMRRIGLSRRILVAAPAFLNTNGTPTRPDDLRSLPLLLPGEQTGTSALRLTAISGDVVEVDIEPRLSAGDYGVLRQASLAGAGVALLPEADCSGPMSRGDLVRILPDWSVADGVLHLVFTSRRAMLPGVRVIIDFLADVLAKSGSHPSCQ